MFLSEINIETAQSVENRQLTDGLVEAFTQLLSGLFSLHLCGKREQTLNSNFGLVHVYESVA